MRPRYRILAADQDITARIADRLIELRITLTSDSDSDSLFLTLDNRDHALSVLPHRTPLRIWLGYGAADQYLGQYLRAEAAYDLVPARLTVRATAADFRGSSGLKAPRTRSWDDPTLGALVIQIAAEYDYTGVCSPELAGIQLEHVDQTEESDLHLLRRLARDHDATFKAAAGRLLLIPRGSGRSAGTGSPLPSVILRPGDITSGRVTYHDRPIYGAVIAKYQDLFFGLTGRVQVGEGGEVFELRRTYGSQALARSAAAAKLGRLNRGTASLTLVLPGRPGLVTEQPLTTAGWQDGGDGEWAITRAVHTLTKSGGLVTELAAEIRLAPATPATSPAPTPAAQPVLTEGVPGQIGNASLTTDTADGISFRWAMPPDNGSPIIDYQVEWEPPGRPLFLLSEPLSESATATSLSFSLDAAGLVSGEYYFRVRARNRFGYAPSWSRLLRANWPPG